MIIELSANYNKDQYVQILDWKMLLNILKDSLNYFERILKTFEQKMVNYNTCISLYTQVHFF